MTTYADREPVAVIYEITWQDPDGNDFWQYTRGLTFQGACRYGLTKARSDFRLMRIARMPDDYKPRDASRFAEISLDTFN